MNAFSICLEAVGPIFLMMFVGFLTRRFNVLDHESVLKSNKVIFNIFMPFMVFNNIYGSGSLGNINAKLFVYAAISTLLMFTISNVASKLFISDSDKRCVVTHAVSRTAFLTMSLPLAQALTPNENTASIAILLVIIVPMFNVFGIVTLSKNNRERKLDKKEILLDIFKNPLNISTFMGLLCIMCRIELPPFLRTTVSSMSSAASCLMIFMLGAFVEFNEVKNNLREIIVTVLFRLILMPMIFVIGAISVGIRGVELVGVIGLFGSASAVASYTMSQAMGADGNLAAELVVFTSAFCPITLFAWCYFCLSLGFII